MHTLITHAAAPGPHCQQALAHLKLPNLAKLLQRLSPGARWSVEPNALSPVQEHVLAHAAGLLGGGALADGLIPWAAHEAHALGLTTLHGLEGWAWITPCHWTVQSDHVEMADPLQLALTPHDAHALFQAMQPYFAEDDITLFAPQHGQPSARWLAKGAVFADLPTASLARVAGQVVDAWMPRQAQAAPLRRLQNEMQMLLYTHHVNDQRSKQHLPIVNAFWASGTGTLAGDAADKPTTAAPISVRDALRAPALHDDAAAWVTAWHALDDTTLAHDLQRAQQGEPVQITLCSDTQARTLHTTPLSPWERLRRRVLPPQARALLKTL